MDEIQTQANITDASTSPRTATRSAAGGNDNQSQEVTESSRLAVTEGPMVLKRTSPNSPIFERGLAVDLHKPNFREIGKGYTGVVFEIPEERAVFKRAISEQVEEKLYQDSRIGKLVHKTFKMAQEVVFEFESNRLAQTPEYFDYYHKQTEEYKEYWEDNNHRFPQEYQNQKRSFIYEERVMPLQKTIREKLIELYCRPDGQEAAKESQNNKDCLARLLLGRRRRTTRPNRFFSLRNFQLHLDQAEQSWPDEIPIFVKQMASSLALLHFFCQTDANDVEFVLGSSRHDRHSHFASWASHMASENDTSSQEGEWPSLWQHCVQLWIIDFDKVSLITLDNDGIAQAAVAAEENDPYLPKPVSSYYHRDYELWEIFSDEYRQTAAAIIKKRRLVHCDHLPDHFLNTWMKYREEKLRNHE